MSPPRCSRLRLSIDSDRDQAFDASQMYQHSHSHSSSANKVFIDSEGRPHDPEFMSHIFPSSEAISNNRRSQKARRLSQTGLIQDDLSDDDMYPEDDVIVDPFRNYTAAAPQRRAVQSQYYYSSPTASPVTGPRPSLYPTPTAAYKARRVSRFAAPQSSATGSSSSSTPTNPSPPSWQQTALLLGESPETTHAEDYSPVSDRWSVRKWSKSSPSRPPAMLDDEVEDEKPRRVLKKKRADMLAELMEDDDEEHAVPEDLEDVPSCTTALKRQWQAFVVSFKLSAHRTKRRIRPRREENVSFIREKDPFGLGLGT